MASTLCQRFDTIVEGGYARQTPSGDVIQSLNPAMPLRPYQRQALVRFLHYLDEYRQRVKPSQLLFHMATGSGKTLVMAAAILSLYERGYRNFLFFVNSTNIIEKTRENFLNPFSSKYLFAERIKFADKEVRLREADNFQNANPDDISIVFTTIQGLHSRLNTPRENSLTPEDFGDQDIVLISDEAHHINALTKSTRDMSSEELLEFDTWESTVRRIFGTRFGNVLLEFTATVELDNPAVEQKYQDKILYQYPLKQFRQDGYSKEVKVLQADIEAPLERALQAIVLSQYRRKVAEKHGVFLKPVLLMKSRTIGESEAIEQEFRAAIDTLDGTRLALLRKSAMGILQHAFAYFDAQGIGLEDLAAEIRQDFDENRCLPINSKNDSEKKQLLVNSLEDKGNGIRLIFAVNMLNEGWDVLNLFDIVRLYNTRDAKQGIPGKTTISEAQLIGRGARYFPFRLEPTQTRDQRKFDHDVDNELRILEELYYHSAQNPRYIDELHKALVQTGIVAPRSRTVTVKVKDSFKATDFWKNGVIFVNRRIRNEREDIFDFSSAAIPTHHRYRLETGFAEESLLLEEVRADRGETMTVLLSMKDLGENVIRTTLQRLSFYEFSNLRLYFPHLRSVHEFISSETFLGSMVIDLTGTDPEVHSLTQGQKLRIALSVLESTSKAIQTSTPDYRGTKVFEPIGIQYCVRDKTLQITVNEGGEQERGLGMRETTNTALYLDLHDKAWYVYDENYGTSEEKHFVRFLHSAMGKLQIRYSDIYLIRNENLFRLYRFSDGAVIEPDFVLFAVDKTLQKPVIFQLFIEPKGEQLLDTDRWKQEFLKQIGDEHRLRQIYEDRDYRLFGLPFYNEMLTKREFEQSFFSVLSES
jgi:type III restriction enzyme